MNTDAIIQHSKHAIQRTLDVLFPPTCAICKKSGHTLCPTCLVTIPRLLPPLCAHCGSTRILNGACQECTFHPLHMTGLRVACPYQEPLRSCIHALKYEGHTKLAEPLGYLLAQTFATFAMQADVLVPMPLHTERQRERGYNQSQLLAEVCAKLIGVPVSMEIVLRTRATAIQAQLKAVERQQNVAGAFTCSSAFATGALLGRRIIIVDDICTTGATLEACAAPLFAAGASAVWGLALARPV